MSSQEAESDLQGYTADLLRFTINNFGSYLRVNVYLLLTEFEGRTVSYGPSFFLLDLWPKREARGP